MRTLVTMLIGIPIALYFAACVLLYVGQRDMLYFPTPNVERAPAEALRLDSGGESLKIWHRARTTSKAILYFGGNAEDVARSIANLRTVFPDYSLYLMNYRGYGGSTGQPSEAALYADALALYDHVNLTHTTISVVGRSLGSAIAAELARVRPVAKLVLVTPFDSIENVVKERFGLLPVTLLLKDKYRLARRAPTIRAPVFIVLAENDAVVARERSQALLAAFASGRVDAVILADTDHDSVASSPQYLTSLRDFFAD